MAPKNGHAIGATTIGAAGGGGVGGGLGPAFAEVLVEFVPRLETVEASVAMIFAAALAFLGAIFAGKFSHSSEKHPAPAEADLPPSPSPDFVVVDPEDEGHGGPGDEEVDLPGEPAGDWDRPEEGEVPDLPLEEREDERAGSTRA